MVRGPDSETPEPKPPASRTALWVRGVLFVSLALNLLILGAVGGLVLNARRGGPEQVPPSALVRDLGLGPYLLALEREDRQALRKAAHRHQPRLKGGRQEMRVTFRETITVLRAETLDAERLRGLIQRQAEVAERGRRLGQDLLLTRITTMTLMERHALADRLEAMMSRRGPRKPRN